MARIPDSELERLKQEVALEELVRAKGIELAPHGKDFIGLCPFHEDKEPSLVVTPAKNLWHCLGACQTGGSVIDWVMKYEGLSFRHAAELLLSGQTGTAQRPMKKGSVAKLPSPFSRDSDDDKLLLQVVDYYHETLKQSPEALAYLEKRGLRSAEAIDRFKLGFANRTLGYRLPDRNRRAGAEIRGKLIELGVYRKSGHEHFAGSLVVPIFDEQGRVVEMYGRKITSGLRKGTPLHLYLPGPHLGVWNLEALRHHEEIILCESLLDALSFWCAGLRNVTTSYGIEGFCPDHLEAFRLHGVKRVLIAYDRDAAGDAAAEKLSRRLTSSGMSCYRILFPKGMDANEYSCKVRPAAQSLELLVRKASWEGEGKVEAFEQPRSDGMALKAEPAPPATPLPPSATPELSVELKGDEIFCLLGDRRWRIRGLSKNTSFELLKVNVLVSRGESMHVDSLDLYSAKQRWAYVRQAADELGVEEAVIKRDLGRLLLRLESLQEEQIEKALSHQSSKEVTLSDEERSRALELLKDPQLLDRILEDFERCGVVGEQVNKLVGYLAAVSRKLEEPLAVIIQSSSAAGKTSLMESILAFVPSEDRTKYSAMTGQSLFYMGESDLKHKILAIVEEEGAERASYALKLLQSEGELTIASTGKDPETGRLITHEYRVEGPVMIFLTTTAIDIDEELLNRCMVLSVDEDREQTRAIHKLQRQRKTLAGLLANQDRELVHLVHQNAQRLLRPILVANPFAERLTFLDDRTRTRRDHMKYLTLIQSIALLHQYQRPLKTVEHHGELVQYIEVTPGDIEVANKLAHQVLGRSLDELSPQTRRLLNLLDEMVSAGCQRQDMARSDYRFSRRQVREHTGWTEFQVRTHMNKLMELEYVLPYRGARGQSFVYELLYDGEGRSGERFLMGLAGIEALGCGYDEKFEHKGGDFEHGRGPFEPPTSPHRAPIEIRSDDEKVSDVSEGSQKFELTPKHIYRLEKTPRSYVDAGRSHTSLAD